MNEWELETALATIEEKDREIDDLKIRLSEALTLLDRKEDEIDKIWMQVGELEIRVNDALEKGPPKQIWVAAINALNLYRGLRDATDYIIDHNDPWRKVIFDISSDGQLTNAHLQKQEEQDHNNNAEDEEGREVLP